MKRIVSVLLASAMLLTLVSCSKAEETTKKKKKAKKTTEETEETTEEPTDEPTETTEDTTTTTTEESTTSTTAPQGNPVQPLHSSVERIDAGYGRHVDIDGDEVIFHETSSYFMLPAEAFAARSLLSYRISRFLASKKRPEKDVFGHFFCFKASSSFCRISSFGENSMRIVFFSRR